MRCAFVSEHRPLFSLCAMCRCLRIHPRGFYAWLKNPLSPVSQRVRWTVWSQGIGNGCFSVQATQRMRSLHGTRQSMLFARRSVAAASAWLEGVEYGDPRKKCFSGCFPRLATTNSVVVGGTVLVTYADQQRRGRSVHFHLQMHLSPDQDDLLLHSRREQTNPNHT